MSNAANSPMSLVLAAVTGVRPGDAGEVRITVDAVVDGTRSELEIAIATDLAPLVALALLERTAEERARRDDLAPALEPIAIGVVPSGAADKVRLHLLFTKGRVLPVEVETTAAKRLTTALLRDLGTGSALGGVSDSSLNYDFQRSDPGA